MERKIYQKLVRDRIPEIMRSQGSVPEVRMLDDAEYKKFLRLKTVEEAGEVNAAKTREQMVKELGDVLEVLEAVMENEGISAEEVQMLKAKRKIERGGFHDRVFLIAEVKPELPS